MCAVTKFSMHYNCLNMTIIYTDNEIDLDSVQHLAIDGIPDRLLKFELPH